MLLIKPIDKSGLDIESLDSNDSEAITPKNHNTPK